MFTGNEFCTAICYDSKKLLIFSNKEEPIHAKSYINFFVKYANSPFEENYEALLALAKSDIKMSVDRLSCPISRASKYSWARRQILRINQIILARADIDQIINLGVEIVESRYATSSSKNLAVSIIKPLIDLWTVIKTI